MSVPRGSERGVAIDNDDPSGQMRASARPCPACGVTSSRPAFVVHGHPHVRCTVCTTLFVSPLPDPDRVRATYLQPDYHETADASIPRMRSEARARARRCLELGARRILEVGCGPGHFLDAARELGASIEGLDPARTATAAADRGHLIHAIWLEQFAPPELYDCLALWEVLEHLPDPAASLAIMREWLCDSAVLALSTPSISGAPARILGRRFPMISPPDHLELFSQRGLRTLLERAGFTVVSWSSFSNLDAATLARGVGRFLGSSAIARPVARIAGAIGTIPARLLDRAGLGTSFEVYARKR